MKKKTIIAILLLAIGLVLILGSAVAVAIYFYANTSGGVGIIGGADYYSTYFLFWRVAYNGLCGILAVIGMALSISSVPIFLKKSK